MAIRKTFSFTREDVVEWIEKNGGSRYVADLVIEDMGRGEFVTKGEVIRLIEERIKGEGDRKEIDSDIKNGMMGLMKF